MNKKEKIQIRRFLAQRAALYDQALEEWIELACEDRKRWFAIFKILESLEEKEITMNDLNGLQIKMIVCLAMMGYSTIGMKINERKAQKDGL